MHIIVFLCTLLFCQYLLPVLQVAEECFFGGSGRIILFGSSDGSEIEAQIGSGGKKNKVVTRVRDRFGGILRGDENA